VHERDGCLDPRHPALLARALPLPLPRCRCSRGRSDAALRTRRRAALLAPTPRCGPDAALRCSRGRCAARAGAALLARALRCSRGRCAARAGAAAAALPRRLAPTPRCGPDAALRCSRGRCRADAALPRCRAGAPALRSRARRQVAETGDSRRDL